MALNGLVQLPLAQIIHEPHGAPCLFYLGYYFRVLLPHFQSEKHHPALIPVRV